jgi:hypothetical protein
MSDLLHGCIELIKAQITPEIEEILRDAFAAHEVDFVLQRDDLVVSFENSEASNGMFEELEKYLVEHKIPFTRCSEGCAEWESEVREYRPAEDLDISVEETYTGQRFVPTDRLWALMDKDPIEIKVMLANILYERDPRVTALEEIAKTLNSGEVA